MKIRIRSETQPDEGFNAEDPISIALAKSGELTLYSSVGLFMIVGCWWMLGLWHHTRVHVM